LLCPEDRMRFLYQHPIVTSLFLTAILLAVAAVSGGVGHGNYTLAILLFPYAAVAVVVLDHFFNSTIPMIVIAVLQFPLYGTLISIGRGRVRDRIVVIALLASHAIAVLVALLIVYS
jgi:hypothetical protein